MAMATFSTFLSDYMQLSARHPNLSADDKAVVESLLFRVKELESKLAENSEEESKVQISVADGSVSNISLSNLDESKLVIDTQQADMKTPTVIDSNPLKDVYQNLPDVSSQSKCDNLRPLLTTFRTYMPNPEYFSKSWNSDHPFNLLHRSSNPYSNKQPTYSYYPQSPIPHSYYSKLQPLKPTNLNCHRKISAQEYLFDSYHPPPEDRCFNCGKHGRPVGNYEHSTYILCADCGSANRSKTSIYN